MGAGRYLSAFAVGPITFYLSRFLLGAAEAGFFPGVILYLTFWFPAAYRARIVAVFMVAIPLSSFLGSPISGALLAMDGLLGLRGWQWLFIVEAIPAVLLGLVSFFGFRTSLPMPNGSSRRHAIGWTRACSPNDRWRSRSATCRCGKS